MSRSFGLFIAVVLCAAMLPAQQSSAMLYATGDVTLNGAKVSGSSSIFAGDRLVTSGSSVASVNWNGSTLIMGPNSAIEYGASGIQVLSGSAHVTTVRGLSVKAGDAVVSPKEASAKFDVVRNSGQLVVTSREGNVAVSDGNQTLALQSGAKTTVSVSGTKSVDYLGGSPSSPASTLVASGPFYSIAHSDDDLPICPSLQTCIRPNVSQIHACKCKP